VILTVEHVAKRGVLRDVSLEVARGEVVGIVGPPGSGKTTLLRCIAKLDEVDGGRIDTDAGIGFVFQRINLWPHKTALGNVIEAPLRVRRVDTKEAVAQGEALLARVGLADQRDVLPALLSPGRQQRVAIARALALRPDLMLFDAPTSMLASDEIDDVLEVMRELAAEGMTMIVSSPEPAFARDVVDRVLTLAGGVVLDAQPA
jgi:ABC-type polar amino acid transport system ATPase subunit